MTTISKAFRRWLAAEEDVRDAHGLLLFHIRSEDLSAQRGQLAVVDILRGDAAQLLSEYQQAWRDEEERMDLGQASPQG